MKLKKLIKEISKGKKEIRKLLRDYLYDVSNCVTIEEAKRKCEKKWPRKK